MTADGQRFGACSAATGAGYRRGARVIGSFRSSSKKGAEFFAEDEAGAGEGDGEEDHRPDAEGASDVATFAEELVKLVDGFGDREILLFLSQDE